MHKYAPIIIQGCYWLKEGELKLKADSFMTGLYSNEFGSAKAISDGPLAAAVSSPLENREQWEAFIPSRQQWEAGKP